MKQIILALMLLPMIAIAQKTYMVKGKIASFKSPAIAVLSYRDGKNEIKDSIEIKNGAFVFKRKVDEPKQAFLSVKYKQSPLVSDYTAFYLENSNIQITSPDSIKHAKIEGSVAEREENELTASIRPLTDIIIKLNKEFAGKPRDEARQKASDSVTTLVATIKKIRMDYVKSHPNSFIALFTYNTAVVDKNFDPVTMEPMFYSLSPALRNSPLGRATLEKVESAKRRQTGIKITDFTQNDLSDSPFKLSSLRGKYVLVDFWASWCVPCRAENPNLVKAYNELKGKNFEVVGVSLDENKEAWALAVKKDGLPWIHVSDLKGWNNAVAALYNISSVPQNLLINPEGMIVAKNLRGDDVLDKLSAYIK